MKVTVVCHNYLPSVRAGAEIMLHEMAKALVAAGHIVSVYVVGGVTHQSPIWVEGVRVHVGRTAKADMRISSPDVVISHLLHSRMAQGFARMCGAKFVEVVHNDNRSTKLSLACAPDLVVFNTNWLREKIKVGTRSIVVHPPVFAEDHRTKSGEKVSLVNLIPEKGSKTFYGLAAMMPDVQFLGVKGGYGDQVIRRMPNVEIVENTEDMRSDVWRKTSILLMPSAYESYGMTGVEAMASGIPVIAHPTPGLKESLGTAGIFLDRDDTESWKEAISDIMSSPTKYRRAALERSGQIIPDQEMSMFVRSVESLVIA